MHASAILYFANVLCAMLQFTVRCIRCAAYTCGLFHGIIITAWEFKSQIVYNQSCRWKVIKYHRETKYNRFMRIKNRFTWEGTQKLDRWYLVGKSKNQNIQHMQRKAASWLVVYISPKLSIIRCYMMVQVFLPFMLPKLWQITQPRK